MSQLMSSIKAGIFLQRKFGAVGENFLAPSFRVLVVTIGLTLRIEIGIATASAHGYQNFTQCRLWVVDPKQKLLKNKSNFKPKLRSKLGEGGQAKVFKAKFHSMDVAMKYIPLDKLKDGYTYHSPRLSYGCHEVYQQEKFRYHSTCKWSLEVIIYFAD